jgi:carbamoyltransferase
MTLTHDGAIAAVADGRLRCAIARERISRVKKDSGVNPQMILYVLNEVGATLADVTAIAISGYFYSPNNEIRLFTADGTVEITSHILDVPSLVQPVSQGFAQMPRRQLFQRLAMRIGNVMKPAILLPHHLCHCASAFYTSPFEKAACFSVDASMVRPEACSLFAYGDGNKLYPFYCPGVMIGNAYSIFTEKLGLGRGLLKSGSTMGLAAYGKVCNNALQRWRTYGQSFYGRQFMPDDAMFIDWMWSELSGRPPHRMFTEEQKDSPEARNVAASLQYVFEEILADHTNRLHAETEAFNGGNLCLSGGSFLNCNANTKIKKNTPFQHLHLFPACGDDGTAAGAALWAAHHMDNQPRYSYRPKDIAYLGRAYATPNVGVPLNVSKVAEVIAAGGIVAWYQGRAEFGPRALGNRSLLADPRRAPMRELINSRIKHREWFRPLAPSVLEEHSSEWFDFDGPSPFMLHTSRVKRPQDIPAVTHVDGTARQQMVSADDNPLYYRLILAFFELTGVPMLLNTSLNANGEPLVETPDDAMRFFQTTGVHALVINDRMLLNTHAVRVPNSGQMDVVPLSAQT